MAEIYPNLAGFVTDVKDGGLAAPPPLSDTEVVLLLGTAQDGPDDAPVVVTIPQAAPDFFGNPTAAPGATLVKAVNDAFILGARNIHGMRIGGEYAALALLEVPQDVVGYIEYDAPVDFDVPAPYYLAGAFSAMPGTLPLEAAWLATFTGAGNTAADTYAFATTGIGEVLSENLAGGKVAARFIIGVLPEFNVVTDIPALPYPDPVTRTTVTDAKAVAKGAYLTLATGITTRDTDTALLALDLTGTDLEAVQLWGNSGALPDPGNDAAKFGNLSVGAWLAHVRSVGGSSLGSLTRVANKTSLKRTFNSLAISMYKMGGVGVATPSVAANSTVEVTPGGVSPVLATELVLAMTNYDSTTGGAGATWDGDLATYPTFTMAQAMSAVGPSQKAALSCKSAPNWDGVWTTRDLPLPRRREIEGIGTAYIAISGGSTIATGGNITVTGASTLAGKTITFNFPSGTNYDPAVIAPIVLTEGVEWADDPGADNSVVATSIMAAITGNSTLNDVLTVSVLANVISIDTQFPLVGTPANDIIIVIGPVGGITALSPGLAAANPVVLTMGGAGNPFNKNATPPPATEPETLFSPTNGTNSDVGGLTPEEDYGDLTSVVALATPPSWWSDPANFTRQSTVPTLSADETSASRGKFYYIRDDGGVTNIYLPAYYTGLGEVGKWGTAVATDLTITVGGTMKSNVETFISSLDVLSGISGYAYDPTNDALILSAAFLAGTDLMSSDKVIAARATLLDDSGVDVGADTVYTAIQAAQLFAAPPDKFNVPYITTPTGTGVDTALTLLEDLSTVNLEIVSGDGTVDAMVRVKDVNTIADIASGVYSYPAPQDSPIGVFGRTILVDQTYDADPGTDEEDTIRTPYIKAYQLPDLSYEAILFRKGATTSDDWYAVGAVLNAGTEEAVFTLKTGSELTVGEYWYNTDVAIYERGVYPGSVYNGVLTTVDTAGSLVPDQGTLRIVKPAGKGFPSVFDVVIAEGATNRTYQDIVVDINSNSVNNVAMARFVADVTHPVTNELQYERQHNLAGVSAAPLAGGDDGVGKDIGYYFQKLIGTQLDTGVLQLLEGHPIDIIVPVGLYMDAESKSRWFGRDRKLWYNADRGIVIINPDGTPVTADPDDADGNNTVTNFAQLISEHCYQTAINGNERIASMAVSPATDTSLRGVAGRTAKLTKTFGVDPTPMRDGFKSQNPLDGRIEDIGRYTNVHAGPDFISPSTDRPTSCEVAYAALISTLPPTSAPTAKIVAGVDTLNYNYSMPQRNALTGMHYATFFTFGGVVYSGDGVTAAGDFRPGQPSDFTRLSTVRVVHSALAGIRRVGFPFIGQPNSIPQRIALNTALDEFLRAMVSAGALSSYEFTIISTKQMQVIGELRIMLTLRVWLELRRITTIVTLALPEG
ncbi:MAG: hypothetical protein A2Y38_04110 [Spirochaetes bacterium GWB1_59_5]|nr:MAG: hypothetical protein A2Y38_04110 [Spirochaetes bacterium GWB1_59_5]